MDAETIEKAKIEALAFIQRCEVVEGEIGSGGYIIYGKSTGALRRQSMELTRALADMRRSS